MQLELDDEQTRALVTLLLEVIEADHYPLSPRIQTLRQILAKLRPEPPPRERLPPLKRYEPPSRGRYSRRR